MVKDDSLYVIAIVAVVAVVGLVIMATGSSTVVVEELPSMAEEDSSAIAGEAFRTSGKSMPSISAGSVNVIKSTGTNWGGDDICCENSDGTICQKSGGSCDKCDCS